VARAGARRRALGAAGRYAPFLALLLVGTPSVSASENVPVVGWLGLSSPEQAADLFGAFRQGLSVPLVLVCAEPKNFLGGVATLNRPGGQTAGFTFLAPDPVGKRLEILKELQPKLSHVALRHSGGEDWPTYWEVIKRAAPKLGLGLLKLPVKERGDLEGAIASAVRQGAGALIAMTDPIAFSAAEHIAAVATEHRLPTAFEFQRFVTAGGLLSYGPHLPDLFRGELARYIDRILKGAAAGDLPVQQPTRFKLVVNLRTARAIGLSIPRALLERADELPE